MNIEKLSLWVIVYGCAVALGTCYIFAFWRPFGFNIFPYLNTIDILTSPLNRLLVTIVPIVIIIISQIEQDDKSSLKLPSYTLTSLAVICYIMAARQAYGALETFNAFEFHFRNEKSIIVILGIFIFISTVFLISSIFFKDSKLQKIAVIGMLQITTVLGMGYQDGKAIFNGAQNVHFLEEKELCEKNGIRDWVYIEKFGTHTFFMNTIDKRLCILEAKEFKLYSRVIKENL